MFPVGCHEDAMVAFEERRAYVGSGSFRTAFRVSNTIYKICHTDFYDSMNLLEVGFFETYSAMRWCPPVNLFWAGSRPIVAIPFYESHCCLKPSHRPVIREISECLKEWLGRHGLGDCVEDVTGCNVKILADGTIKLIDGGGGR